MKISLNVENKKNIFEFPLVFSNGRVCKKIFEENIIDYNEILNIQIEVFDRVEGESIIYEIGEDIWDLETCFFKSLKKTFDIRSKEMDPNDIECDIIVHKNRFSHMVSFCKIYEKWSGIGSFSVQDLCSQIFRNNWLSEPFSEPSVFNTFEESHELGVFQEQNVLNEEQSNNLGTNQEQVINPQQFEYIPVSTRGRTIDQLVTVFDNYISYLNELRDDESYTNYDYYFPYELSNYSLQTNPSFDSLLTFVNDEIGNGNYFEDVQVVCDEKDFEQLKTVVFNDITEDKVINDTCFICMEKYQFSEKCTVLTCKHCFHPKCIQEWLCNYNHRCPTCRVEVGIGKPQIS